MSTFHGLKHNQRILGAQPAAVAHVSAPAPHDGKPKLDVVIQDLLDQLRGAWRFRWIALIVAWCAAALLWAIVFLIPDTYQASARVFVDTKTALSEVTRGIGVEPDVDTQIQRIRQALLGGPELRRVAEETDLMGAAATPRAKQLVLEKLRAAIDISGGMSPAAGVFTISYKNHSRDKSVQVVDRLLNTFVEGALGGKRQGSEQAQQFLTSQISEYERRLSAAEEQLAAFKKRNVGLMPGAQGDYFTRLQGEMEGLSKAQQNLAVAMRRRDDLQRQLRGEQAFMPSSGPGTKTAAGSGAPATDTSARIAETQAKLDDLLLRFTENHPDVVALRQTLNELKQREQAEIEAVKRGDAGAAEHLGLTANPVYQNVQLQYNQAQVDIGAIQTEIAEHQSKIASLRSLINTAPEVEAEFTRLNRDYDVTRAQYKALLERLERSRLGEEAQATGTVKFEVIDPPTASFTPVEPKRALLVIGAFLLALLAGGGAAYVLSLWKPVFLSARQLTATTGLPVLGAVSVAWLQKHRTEQYRGVIVYAGTAAALLLTAILVVALQGTISHFVRGLMA
jgi:polysaccharide chain length determinant protein (PEP-CTERM system associated)